LRQLQATTAAAAIAAAAVMWLPYGNRVTHPAKVLHCDDQ
jgi:hypothetical protein